MFLVCILRLRDINTRLLSSWTFLIFLTLNFLNIPISYTLLLAIPSSAEFRVSFFFRHRIFLIVLVILFFNGAMSLPAWENVEECVATIWVGGRVEFFAVSLILCRASWTSQSFGSGAWLWVAIWVRISGLVTLFVVWTRTGHLWWRWCLHRQIFFLAPFLSKLNKYPPLLIMGRFLHEVKVTIGSDPEF